MARIIESTTGTRRIIKLSTNDIISVVQEYQRLTNGLKYTEEIRDVLDDGVLYLPED